MQNIVPSKKLFQKITRLAFSTLDHDLCICSACYDYYLCSLDPGESIGNNYSITQPIKTILKQEKHIFSILSKSNVDEAQIQNWQFAYFSIFPRNFFFQMGLKTFWWVVRSSRKYQLAANTLNIT